MKKITFNKIAVEELKLIENLGKIFRSYEKYMWFKNRLNKKGLKIKITKDMSSPFARYERDKLVNRLKIGKLKISEKINC